MALDTIQTITISLTVNGKEYSELTIPSHITLIQLLKEKLYLQGTKLGCGVGECGACTIIMNGRTVNSCLVLAAEAAGATIRTIEGEAKSEDEISELQAAFVKHGAIQCGFCTPGMVMSARELLEHNASPCREEIREAIAGNICRCTGYINIIDAIEDVANNK